MKKNEKKIGILTFHKSINYGSVLQAWALQDIIEKKGYNVEIIDYEPQAYKSLYHIFKSPTSLWRIKFNLRQLPLSGVLLYQSKRFCKFRKRCLHLSEKKYNVHSDLHDMVEKYDVIVCGSDQIWNINAYDCDLAYFLPVAYKGQKVAYAVSVNTTKFTEKKCDDVLRWYIWDFDYISIRETSGAEKISRFIDKKKNITTVLDPTLLHKKEDFDNICSKRLINNDYIFLYNVWSCDDAADAAVTLSAKLNLPVYTTLMTRDKSSICKLEKKGIQVEKHFTSPQDFISLIKNASYVVTDSFHGTAFSIIFEKNFVCINDRHKDGSFKNDERLESILLSLRLKDRYITKEQVIAFPIEHHINYAEITPRRMKLVNYSLEWLFNAIKGDSNNEARKN